MSNRLMTPLAAACALALSTVPSLAHSRPVTLTAQLKNYGGAGAYLAARLAGASPLVAAGAGNRLAARVVQHRGAVIDRTLMQDLLQVPISAA